MFAGTARISQALNAAGFVCFPVDTCLSSGHNVLRPDVGHRIVHMIQSRRVQLLWLGMPCTTFSRARKNDGLGPGPLRTPTSLWGLQNLSRTNKRKLIEGNNLFHFMLRLIHACIDTNTPFVLENPLTSMLWLMEPWEQLRIKHDFQYTELDFCQYGEVWKKPTRLASYLFDASSLGRRCTGRNDYCSATHKKHIPLRGRDDFGTFMTLRAQPYPFRLVQDFAGLCARTLRG